MTTGSLDDAKVQKSRQLELPLEGRGEAPRAKRSGQASLAVSGAESPGTSLLMEEALNFAKVNKLRVIPACSYAHHYLNKSKISPE